MTGPMPDGAPRRFTPGELDDVSGMGPDDLAAEMRVARELETLAAGADVAPSPAFADRVMGAIAAEPSPAPARAAGRAIRHAALGAFLLSIRDAWRVTVRPGFPMAVRAQAFALILVVLVVGTSSAAATAGAIGLLGGDRSSPSPDATLEAPSFSEQPALESPSLSAPSLEPESASPSDSVEPSETPDEESASPGETEKPGESGDDDGGSSGSGSGSGSGSASDDGGGSSGSGSDDSGSRTPRPAETPRAVETQRPDETQQPDETAKPGETPKSDS